MRNIFELQWADFKSAVDTRSLVIQWIDINNSYELYATDNIFSLYCAIRRDDPNSTTAVSEFEASYKAAGNKPITRTNFIKKSFSVSSQQTNAAVWTPASGKRVVITGYQISIHNNTLSQHSAQLFDNTNSAANIIYTNITASGSNYDVSATLNPPIISSAINNVIRATTSGSIRIAGVLFGYEI